MSNNQERSRLESARSKVPDELIEEYQKLIADFGHVIHQHDELHHIPYMGLAQLITMGWRLSAEPDDSRQGMRAFEIQMNNFSPTDPSGAAKLFYWDDSWGTIAWSYKQAGDTLCSLIENDPNKMLVYPTLFCYRHMIEMQLKALLMQASPNGRESLAEMSNAHSLGKLFTLLDRCLDHGDQIDRSGNRTTLGEEMKILNKWATKFNMFDKNSDRFRYAEPMGRAEDSIQELYTTKFYEYPELEKLLGVKDFKKLRLEMSKLSDAIMNIGMVISVRAEFGGPRPSDEN